MDFVSIKQAAVRVGKNEKTIRRLIEKLIAVETDEAGKPTNKTHVDRQHVRPTPDELASLRKKGQPHKWRISVDLVDRKWGSRPSHRSADSGKGDPKRSSASNNILTVLRTENELLKEQLTIKDGQLNRKDTQIDGLNKSLHEASQASNRYAGIIQEQLKHRELPATIDEKPSTFVAGQPQPTSPTTSRVEPRSQPHEVRPHSQDLPGESSSTTLKRDEPTETERAPKSRRGFWSRILRRS